MAGRQDGKAARRRAIAPILLLLAVLSPRRLPAQQPLHAAGRIVRLAGRDTIAVPGIRVVLHRVSPQGSGPLDSLRADPQGRFRFTMRRDTTATYLVSAKYAGVAYFSPPLGTGTPLDTTVLLFVADTSSGSSAPVALTARHLVIERPTADGSRRVTDLLVLHNPGPDTRVAPDTVRAAWGIRLPRGVVDAAPGDGDFSPDAVVFRNDSVLIFAPISLGDAQMVVQYTLPANALVVGLPVEDSTPSLNVLVEEGGARVEGKGLAAGTPEQLDGRDFTRWSGAIPAGSMVTVRLGGGGAVPAWILPFLILLTAGGLGAVAVRAWRARPRMAAPVPPAATALVDRVARLDLQYAGREREIPPEEWARYLADRSHLARQLEAALAARSSSA